MVPGTTLDFLKVDLGGDVSLYDTPGLILPHQLTSRLDPDELKVPRKFLENLQIYKYKYFSGTTKHFVKHDRVVVSKACA